VRVVHRIRRSSQPGARRLRSGFTLIEILIATSILTLGLVGILALFPVAIRAGRQVVEDSNAVVIAQSVAEAIRSGIRNRKGYTRSGHVYFVFAHDGVRDSIPADTRLLKPRDDYYVLLPRFQLEQSFSGRTESERRRKALASAKTFVYPETDTRSPNGGGNADLADDDGDDARVEIGGRRMSRIRVEGVYELGQHLVPGGVPGAGAARSGGARVLEDMLKDSLKQYSFAFAIRPSYFDADLSEGRSFQPANRLYHVTVMVFRGLMIEPRDGHKLIMTEDEEPPKPVYELEFEVSQ
jgi:prepilin-type N-terminal cleavage/methylation domain-containing protein